VVTSMENTSSVTDSAPLKPSRRSLFIMVIVLSVQALLIFMGYRLVNTIILVSVLALWALDKITVNARIVGMRSDLMRSWYLIVIAVFGLQTCFTLALTLFLPEVGEHAMNRLPVDPNTDWPTFLLLVGFFSPLLEEFFYRGIVQDRLSWFVSDIRANLLTSTVFAFAHWFPGPAYATAIDLLFVFTSSLFFGLVYSRSKNTAASLVVHSGYNLYAVVFSLFLLLLGY